MFLWLQVAKDTRSATVTNSQGSWYHCRKTGTSRTFDYWSSYFIFMESVTKSIIYGNSYENRYGRFMPICSSISDRGISSHTQLPSSISLIICTILRISKNTIELLMPIEFNKFLWFSSQKRKMLTISIFKGAIVIRQLKGLGISYFIFLKNLVNMS